jgi:hypothetical protein
VSAIPNFALALLHPQLVCANFNPLMEVILNAIRTASVQPDLALGGSVLGIKLANSASAPVNVAKSTFK